MDDHTFHDPRIVREADHFLMVKIDVSRGGDPDHERLLSRYEVRGVPAVLFLDYEGQERHDLRLVDYLAADEFLMRMKSLQTKGADKNRGPDTS